MNNFIVFGYVFVSSLQIFMISRFYSLQRFRNLSLRFRNWGCTLKEKVDVWQLGIHFSLSIRFLILTNFWDRDLLWAEFVLTDWSLELTAWHGLGLALSTPWPHLHSNLLGELNMEWGVCVPVRLQYWRS